MTYYVGNMPVGDDELMHYGTKGMRWGQRRFQNRDGSLTAAGRLRYGWGRAKRGAGRAYGQARRTAKRTYKKAGNWYQRNKKTIGRVALGAGIAAAGAVGFRNRKAIARAAKVLGGKAFPAGTRRAQRLSKLRYNIGNSKVNRHVRNATDAFKGAVGKSADYIRRTPSRISAKRMNASRLNKQKDLYRKTGIRGDLMTDKVIASEDRKKMAKEIRNAKKRQRNLNKQKINQVKQEFGVKSTRRAKNLAQRMAFVERKVSARLNGKDLAKGKLSDVAKLRLRRAADKVGGAYQKTKSKARNISKRIPTGVTVNVNGRSHTIRRKHVAGAAGLAGGAYGGYRYYKRRKNSRKRR